MMAAQDFLQFYQGFFSVNHSKSKTPKNIKALILAPHPDDECLMASTPLRLKLENQAQVIAACITLGSNTARQEERRSEFTNACAVLGFTPLILAADWNEKFTTLKKLIVDEKINFITSPHLKDHHPAHIRTSELARQLIEETAFSGVFCETEFWGEIENPNLLVEVTREAFTLEFDALTKHVGEISRNPYHLRLAANLVNNVRRGAEKVQVIGSASPEFAFGNLISAYKVSQGILTPLPPQILSSEDDISRIF